MHPLLASLGIVFKWARYWYWIGKSWAPSVRSQKCITYLSCNWSRPAWGPSFLLWILAHLCQACVLTCCFWLITQHIRSRVAGPSSKLVVPPVSGFRMWTSHHSTQTFFRNALQWEAPPSFLLSCQRCQTCCEVWPPHLLLPLLHESLAYLISSLVSASQQTWINTSYDCVSIFNVKAVNPLVFPSSQYLHTL